MLRTARKKLMFIATVALVVGIAETRFDVNEQKSTTTYTSAVISIKLNVHSTDHSMYWVIKRDPLPNDPSKQRPMNDCALPTTRV